MKKIKVSKISEKYIKIAFIIIVFLLCFISATKVKNDNAPDEQMKKMICQYIYENNVLPKGDDPAIINGLWGTSYGFTPILSYMISSLFMKITSIFTTSEFALLVAARFVSVLCYTGLAIMAIKIGEKLFNNKAYKWLFIILITCLPQMLFLGSYINNDSIAVFSISLIIYAWIIGLESKWNYKSVIILAIGIGICALSYYNAYGYILTSMIIYVFSYFINKVDGKIDVKNLLKKGSIIAIIAFIIAGWWFVRSYIIYDGDFLGLKTSDACTEIHAQENFKPSKIPNPNHLNMSFSDMLFKQKWIAGTMKSFIGVFGYCSIPIPYIVYRLYYVMYIIAFLGYILYIIKNIKMQYYKREKNRLLLEVIFVINMCITVVLSLYYSYFCDFQPQGRYIMPLLIPLMYFITKGLQALLHNILQIKKIKTIIERKIEIEKVEIVLIYILVIGLFLVPFKVLPRAWW